MNMLRKMIYCVLSLSLIGCSVDTNTIWDKVQSGNDISGDEVFHLISEDRREASIWRSYFSTVCEKNINNCKKIIRISIQENKEVIFYEFINSNINPDIKFSNSSIQTSPIFSSIMHRRLDFVESLILDGVDLEQVNGLKQTPLLSANSNQFDIIHLLISRGANLSVTDLNGRGVCDLFSNNKSQYGKQKVDALLEEFYELNAMCGT